MDKKSADLKAATSHTPIDGLHAKNSHNYLQENQKIIEAPEILQKISAQKKFNLNRKKISRNLN